MEQILDRDQLEAVCAAQWALSADRWCGVFLRAVVVNQFVSLLSLALVAQIFHSPLALLALAGAVSWACGDRVAWWAQVLGDAVCIRTTRFPAPLMHALRKLALYNGDQVRVRSRWAAWVGTGVSNWLVPLDDRVDYITTIGRSSRKIRISSEQQIDIQLVTRAAVLKHSLAHASTYSDWKRLQRISLKAEQDGVDGQPIELEGLEIWPAGAQLPEKIERMPSIKVFNGDSWDQT